MSRNFQNTSAIYAIVGFAVLISPCFGTDDSVAAPKAKTVKRLPTKAEIDGAINGAKEEYRNFLASERAKAVDQLKEMEASAQANGQLERLLSIQKERESLEQEKNGAYQLAPVKKLDQKERDARAKLLKAYDDAKKAYTRIGATDVAVQAMEERNSLSKRGGIIQTVNDPLVVGSIWEGRRDYLDNPEIQSMGNIRMKITERDGRIFKAEGLHFDGANRDIILKFDGEITRTGILYREVGEGQYKMTCKGGVKNNIILYQFEGKGYAGVNRNGEGEMRLVPTK